MIRISHVMREQSSILSNLSYLYSQNEPFDQTSWYNENKYRYRKRKILKIVFYYLFYSGKPIISRTYYIQGLYIPKFTVLGYKTFLDIKGADIKGAFLAEKH